MFSPIPCHVSDLRKGRKQKHPECPSSSVALSFGNQEEQGEVGASCPKGPGTTLSLLASYLACLLREDEQYLKEIW